MKTFKILFALLFMAVGQNVRAQTSPTIKKIVMTMANGSQKELIYTDLVGMIMQTQAVACIYYGILPVDDDYELITSTIPTTDDMVENMAFKEIAESELLLYLPKNIDSPSDGYGSTCICIPKGATNVKIETSAVVGAEGGMYDFTSRFIHTSTPSYEVFYEKNVGGRNSFIWKISYNE